MLLLHIFYHIMFCSSWARSFRVKKARMSLSLIWEDDMKRVMIAWNWTKIPRNDMLILSWKLTFWIKYFCNQGKSMTKRERATIKMSVSDGLRFLFRTYMHLCYNTRIYINVLTHIWVLLATKNCRLSVEIIHSA